MIKKVSVVLSDESYKDAQEEISKVYGLVEGMEDGTYSFDMSVFGKIEYNLIGKIEFKTGYQVSFVNDRNKCNIREFMNDFATMSDYDIPNIGVYQGEAELSFHIEDLKEAMALGTLFEQYSIWDWANGREIVIKR